MKKLITGAALSAAPLLAFAQTTVQSILINIREILNFLIPMLITAAVLYFIYGIVMYVVAADSDKKEEARSIVIRGILGLFVIVSVWGLVGVIQSSFGIGSGGSLTADQIPGVGV